MPIFHAMAESTMTTIAYTTLRERSRGVSWQISIRLEFSWIPTLYEIFVIYILDEYDTSIQSNDSSK